MPAIVRERCDAPLASVPSHREPRALDQHWFPCDARGAQLLDRLHAHPRAIGIEISGHDFTAFAANTKGDITVLAPGCTKRVVKGTVDVEDRVEPPTPVPPEPRRPTRQMVSAQLSPDGDALPPLRIPASFHADPPSLVLDGARFVPLSGTRRMYERALPPARRRLPAVYGVLGALDGRDRAVRVEIASVRPGICNGTTGPIVTCRANVVFSNIETLHGKHSLRRAMGLDYVAPPRPLGAGQSVILLSAGDPATSTILGIVPADQRTTELVRLAYAAIDAKSVSAPLHGLMSAHPDAADLAAAPNLAWVTPSASGVRHRRSPDGCLTEVAYEPVYVFRGT